MSFSGGRQSWKAEYLFNRRICSWCRTSAAHGEPLKRCRGCDAAVYCGRECQAAAWSRHRALCRSGSLQADPDTSFAGYATAIGLGEALNKWVKTHHYCLTVIVHIMLRRSGGAVFNSQRGRVIIINVESRRLDADANPATDDPTMAFRVHITKIMTEEYAPTLTSPEVLERMRPAGEPEAGFRGDIANAAPAGFVPIVFAVEGTKIALATHCAVYRASHHPDDTPLDEETIAVFDDLENVFVNFIRIGVVFRRPADELAADPEAWSMVQGRKRWRWRREEDAWRLVDTVMVLDRIPRRIALTARSLWTRFQQW